MWTSVKSHFVVKYSAQYHWGNFQCKHVTNNQRCTVMTWANGLNYILNSSDSHARQGFSCFWLVFFTQSKKYNLNVRKKIFELICIYIYYSILMSIISVHNVSTILLTSIYMMWLWLNMTENDHVLQSFYSHSCLTNVTELTNYPCNGCRLEGWSWSTSLNVAISAYLNDISLLHETCIV